MPLDHPLFGKIRHDWALNDVLTLFELPFNDLLYVAHCIHRQHFDANFVQKSTLMSIKTGACPEDCAYCPQSVHYKTDLEREPLKALEEVVDQAKRAKACGASRFCMGAAWRNPRGKDFERVLDMISAVKLTGLETCATLGMLTRSQAAQLKQAGLDYYNHNLDSSPEFYEKIITTRTYADRLNTLSFVREAGLKVCCGGIVGMGETQQDRASLLVQLANLPEHPHSVPINHLVKVEGTPLASEASLPILEFVRTIAIARIMMPASVVRLSAGRETMDDATQALCFFAGANSIFYGEKLLTTSNPETQRDNVLLNELGIHSQTKIEVAV